jgi:hypothetical protein
MTQLSMLYSGVHVGRLYIAAKLLAAICVDPPLYTDCGGVSQQLAVG